MLSNNANRIDVERNPDRFVGVCLIRMNPGDLAMQVDLASFQTSQVRLARNPFVKLKRTIGRKYAALRPGPIHMALFR